MKSFPVTGDIRWGYASNHWKLGPIGFARREEHERAFKVTAACGFRAIELTAGTGRWEPLGRPASIEMNYGSLQKFAATLQSWGVEQVASTFYDPGQRSFEDLHHGLDPVRSEDQAVIVRTAQMYLDMLRELGGSCLVVRPFRSFWQTGALTKPVLQTAAACWNEVGTLAQARGLRLAAHLDALSALRSADELEEFLALTASGGIGLAIDTAELTIAGHDVTSFYRRFHARVRHFHFKDALATDTLQEYALHNAERALLQAGGSREIQRWFSEMGTQGGLVDFPALARALREHHYSGWIIVESDRGPPPVAAAMMSNAWYVRNVILPALEPPAHAR